MIQIVEHENTSPMEFFTDLMFELPNECLSLEQIKAKKADWQVRL